MRATTMLAGLILAVSAAPALAGVDDMTLIARQYPPSVIAPPEALYAPGLLSTRLGSDVVLRMTVTADGKASDLRIARSSGNPATDNAALADATSWRFKPARRNGHAVAAQIDAGVRLPQR